MYPKLFEIGPIPVYSYGLMLGIAFLVGSSLLTKELRRHKLDENLGVVLTFLALIGGIAGAKLFYIIEEWNFGSGLPLSTYFSKDIIFSPAGLTFYGGLIVAGIVVTVYCKIKKLSVLEILDCMSPSMLIGYGIARIGCHLAGDGDYGIPVNGTMWEWLGVSYSNGTVPTPVGVLVHPTSVYESIIAAIFFYFLWKNRDKFKVNGLIFGIYLILTAVPRFLIEFIRLNPKIAIGLSQAQFVSIFIFLIGLYLVLTKLPLQKIMLNAKAKH